MTIWHFPSQPRRDPGTSSAHPPALVTKVRLQVVRKSCQPRSLKKDSAGRVLAQRNTQGISAACFGKVLSFSFPKTRVQYFHKKLNFHLLKFALRVRTRSEFARSLRQKSTLRRLLLTECRLHVVHEARQHPLLFKCPALVLDDLGVGFLFLKLPSTSVFPKADADV